MCANEKREIDRFEINESSECAFASPVLEDFGTVKIVNISINGIGLLTKESLHAGLLLAVGLSNRTRKFERLKLVRITHASNRPDGSCLAGGQFDEPLTSEELRNLTM